MATLNKLTARTAVAAKKPGRYGDGGGLWLDVSPAGNRAWAFRYRLAGRSREMGLGKLDAVTLAEARDAAADARKLLHAGADPLEQRDAARAAAKAAKQAAAVRTFRDVAGLYMRAHEAAWRNAKHRAQWGATLDAYAYPHLGDVPVSAVEKAHVTAALEPIWQAKPETASRLRGRIEAVLDYAAARGWRTGDNPAAWRGNLAHILPRPSKLARVEHHAALPWQDMAAFLATLDGHEGASPLALRFVILTAARTGEAIGATWGEVDLQGAVWTVPGARMKAGQDHRVPMSPTALDVLRCAAKLHPGGTPRAESPVFPGRQPGKGLSNMALLVLLRRMGRGDLTTHGFRSTFRDWAAEATGYPREVCEAALAHTLRDKVEAAYRRGDLFEKRRRLMAEWADYCARPAGHGRGTVVPIRAGTA